MFNLQPWRADVQTSAAIANTMYVSQTVLHPSQDRRQDVSSTLADIPRIMLLVDTIGEGYDHCSRG